MIAAGSVKVCVFDAYGTVFDVSTMAELFRADLGDKADALFKHWRRRQLEISWLPGRHQAAADFWRVTDEALDETMTAFGFDDRGLRARLMESWLCPRLYADAKPTLLRLRQAGFANAILSNGTQAMLAAGAAAGELEPVLDVVLSAAAAGVFKPNPAVYKMVMDHFGVAPQEVCFISGNTWDINGGALAGFQTVWINRDGIRPDSPPRGTQSTVATLTDLPTLLGA
ncbi:haloacid dehalogenase type II [Paramagnetospirillum kuznetsovii]|uniref:(S)-2-haloacid dehalogenase n=1 Tax=Paramagnetospirillum kuznetsovii TaxID=2053833 RepID=A0A364P021_9PROT|nr:haloacid dehalogenase type II [Paramagnetospirillum kuznetsovii]RAU22656.1 haloacid dehalogenase type II [Paramagnetospirillum kuznetsovii]